MSKKSSTSDCLIVSYRRALQAAEAKFAAEIEAKSVSLTYRQFIVLRAVAEFPNANQTKLVEKTAMDRSTLADVIARMLASGLLLRERNELDARANMVQLSGTGKSVLAKARHANKLASKVLQEKLPELQNLAA